MASWVASAIACMRHRRTMINPVSWPGAALATSRRPSPAPMQVSGKDHSAADGGCPLLARTQSPALADATPSPAPVDITDVEALAPARSSNSHACSRRGDSSSGSPALALSPSRADQSVSRERLHLRKAWYAASPTNSTPTLPAWPTAAATMPRAQAALLPLTR